MTQMKNMSWIVIFIFFLFMFFYKLTGKVNKNVFLSKEVFVGKKIKW